MGNQGLALEDNLDLATIVVTSEKFVYVVLKTLSQGD
jgi:hypothetical protein